MSDDPRKGRVSASRVEILCLCPGSEQLRRTLPQEALDTGDEYTDLGSKLHKAWETENSFELSESSLEIYKNGLQTLGGILTEWCREFNIEKFEEGERELRLFLNDPSTMLITASGQLDRHFIAGPYVLICDFKALWAPNLTPAERNYQGRLQAVMAAKEYDAKHVRMAFVKAMFGRQDVADYNDVALGFAEASIHRAIWESEQPGAQRRPGRHCTYCACKAFCEDAASYSMLPSVQRRDTLKDTLALVETLPPEDIVPVWRKWGEVEKIFAAMETRLKALPAEEHERLGLKLTAGKKLDRIKDNVGAFNALRAAGLSSEQIIGALRFGKGELVNLYQTMTNCRDAEGEAWYNSQLGDFIERDRAKPSLVEK
jgi:hypothetical protein